MYTLSTLYEQAWRRFSQEFQDFWTMTPGPDILTNLQQSKCENCSLVRDFSRGGCKVWLEGVKSWATRSDRTARWIKMYADNRVVHWELADRALRLNIGGESSA